MTSTGAWQPWTPSRGTPNTKSPFVTYIRVRNLSIMSIVRSGRRLTSAGLQVALRRSAVSECGPDPCRKTACRSPFRGRLCGAEHIDGDAARVDRAGPTGIERDVRDQSLQLGLRHPVVERPLQVASNRVGPIERSQHCHGDQATVTLAEIGMLPYVAE